MPINTDDTLPLSAAGAPVGGRCGRYVVESQIGAGGMGIVLAAHDPVLGRKVALKLLHAETGEARIELEAQAMARLAHPNVVTVFEVDRVDGRTFVAMELVEGSTLRRWLTAAQRTWREIVDMYIAAGRGLAAAHAAGLVHRDFKPDNVLIGRDGRPRVSDFGLVYDTAGAIDDGETAASESPVDTTLRGSAVGTPAYMSPEQWQGGRVDARGDQFAFCVALWEALWGRRPFAGMTPIVLRAAVQAGAIDAPPGLRHVPRRIISALRRGLAVDPAARWTDMTELLAALTRAGQRRRRWVIAATAGAAALAAAAATWMVAGRDAPDPCGAPVERVSAVWQSARRLPLAGALITADPRQGAERASRIGDALDGAASSWSAMYVEACRATRVEGRQSDALLDRRMTCLDRWLAELGDTVQVADAARDPAAVDNAVHAAAGMSPLAACADVSALAEVLPPPGDLAHRLAADSLARRTRELDVAQRAGRLAGLAERAHAVVDEARRLGYAPTLAEALTVAARIAFSDGDEAVAEQILRELAPVAASARDDATAAFAWSNLVSTLGRNLGNPAGAVALIPTADAAVLRAGDPPGLRAALLYNQAVVADFGPHPEQGLEMLGRAQRLLEAAGATAPRSPLGPQLADVVFEIGSGHASLGHTDAAIASYHQAIDRWRALYGVDSPDEAFAWQDIGATLQQAGRHDEALPAFESALRIRENRLGASPMTAASEIAVASAQNALLHWDQALAHYDRAIEIDRKLLAPEDIQVLRVLYGRATTLTHVRRFDEAARDYDAAIAGFDRGGIKSPDVPIALYNRGKLAALRGQCEAALRDQTRAIALFEELRGPRSGMLAYALVGQARCSIQLGRSRDAVAALERVLGLESPNAYQLALARAYLGRVRIELGGDVAAGRAMIDAARITIASDLEGPSVLHELDAWLARR